MVGAVSAAGLLAEVGLVGGTDLSFRAERARSARVVEGSQSYAVEGSLSGRQRFLDSGASRLRSE